MVWVSPGRKLGPWSEFPFLYRFTILLNSGGSNSPWSEFWSEFPHFMGMGVVPAPSKIVEKCRTCFWHFLTLYDVFCTARKLSRNVEIYFWHLLTIFDVFWRGPFCGLLMFLAAERRTLKISCWLIVYFRLYPKIASKAPRAEGISDIFLFRRGIANELPFGGPRATEGGGVKGSFRGQKINANFFCTKFSCHDKRTTWYTW